MRPLYFVLPLFFCLLLTTVLQPGPLSAEPVTVRYTEGSVHGFLVLRALDGKVLATGDLTQVVRGFKVFSHLAFRFRDGSIDDETTAFSQQELFGSSVTITSKKDPNLLNLPMC